MFYNLSFNPIMKNFNRILIFLIAGIASLLIYACKDYITMPERTDKLTKKYSSFNSILPINLDEFNILPKDLTKSSFTDSVSFSLDSSMLNWGEASQVNRNNGLVFTQIPFYFNDSSAFAAISDNIEYLHENKVPLKSFYIVAEDCFNNKKIDYIVTMVPTKKFYEDDNDFDFLNMSNFSGVVFYSDSCGNIFKINSMINGIINRVNLSQESVVENPRYVGVYSNETASTKSDQDPVLNGGELLTIVIYADNQSSGGYGDIIIIGKTPESDNQGEKPEEVVDHTNKPPLGGGSDSSALLNQYTLTVKFKGCYQEPDITIDVPIGKSVSVTAKDFSSDTCVFMHWEGPLDILSNNRSISLTISESTTITAYYMGKSKGDCFDLAKIASDTKMKTNMKAIIDSTHRDSIEHGFKMRSDSSKLYGKGTGDKINYPKETGKTYIQRFHTHPSGSKFCSGADIWCIFDMINENQIKEEDINDFRYGMIAYDTSGKGEHTIHIINIADKNKLMNYFDQLISNFQDNIPLAKKSFTSSFNDDLNNISSYEGKTLFYTKTLNEIGLSISKGDYTNNITSNSSAVIYWNKLNIKTKNGTEMIDFKDCYYEY